MSGTCGGRPRYATREAAARAAKRARTDTTGPTRMFVVPHDDQYRLRLITRLASMRKTMAEKIGVKITGVELTDRQQTQDRPAFV